MTGLYARVIGRLGDRAEASAPTLAAFSTVLVGSVLLSEASTTQRAGLTLGLVLCAIGSALPATRVLALAAACVLHGVRVVQSFPATANHSYLQLVLLLLSALLAGRSAAENKQLLSSQRAITAAVFFHAGLQKLLYGTYFDGRMLALLISKHARYQLMFEPLIGHAEVVRLAGLNAHLPGQGPYIADSVLLTVIANATWLLELAIAALLLTPLAIAPWLGAALIILIEAGARETVFGALMLGLLALFLKPQGALKAQRVMLTLIAIACAIAYGFLPGRDAVFLEALP